MNFSPQNQQGLIGLIEALKGGMDPTQAYGISQDIYGDQANRVAQRQERLGGLADLLTQAASGGIPYAGAEALLDAQPGPMGPAVQDMLQGAYPTQNAQAGMTNANGQTLNIAQPSRSDVEYGPQSQGMSDIMQYGAGPSSLSPAYVPEVDPAQAEAQATAEVDADWGVFQQAMAQARAKGMDAQTAYLTFAQADPFNAQMVASDPSRVKGIMTATFGSTALIGTAAPVAVS